MSGFWGEISPHRLDRDLPHQKAKNRIYGCWRLRGEFGFLMRYFDHPTAEVFLPKKRTCVGSSAGSVIEPIVTGTRYSGVRATPAVSITMFADSQPFHA